jgi:hypothetical protein
VADFSAREGTTVDDPATHTDMSGNVKIMVPLVGDEVACPVCKKSEVQLFFMNLTNLGKHLDLHHAEARIQWGCRQCARSFPKLHGARCHLPKCSGPSQTKDEPYKCEACLMSFGTQRGLSMHERHAHPAVRNLKRKEATSFFNELESESIEEWRRCLRNEIEKDHEVPQPTLQLYHELKKLWDNFNEHKKF